MCGKQPPVASLFAALVLRAASSRQQPSRLAAPEGSIAFRLGTWHCFLHCCQPRWAWNRLGPVVAWSPGTGLCVVAWSPGLYKAAFLYLPYGMQFVLFAVPSKAAGIRLRALLDHLSKSNVPFSCRYGPGWGGAGPCPGCSPPSCVVCPAWPSHLFL